MARLPLSLMHDLGAVALLKFSFCRASVPHLITSSCHLLPGSSLPTAPPPSNSRLQANTASRTILFENSSENHTFIDPLRLKPIVGNIAASTDWLFENP